MKIYGPGIAVLFALFAACWFGSRLGPREPQRPATREAAIVAAEGFIRTQLNREYIKRGLGSIQVNFFTPTTAEPDPGTEYSVGSHDLWIVKGTATAATRSGTVDHPWTIRERWDGVSHWRAKSVEVVGPKRVHP